MPSALEGRGGATGINIGAIMPGGLDGRVKPCDEAGIGMWDISDNLLSSTNVGLCCLAGIAAASSPALAGLLQWKPPMERSYSA